MKQYLFYTLLFISSMCGFKANAQYHNNVDETFLQSNNVIADTSLPSTTIVKPTHNPRTATKRSALIPGWGQAYNKEYWKIPIVYGALSIPTITFIYNNTWYNRTKKAYSLLFALTEPGATRADTLNYQTNTHRQLIGFSLGSLQTFRNNFRRDRDMSLLWFVIVWGLNVVDATVFGHLKEFDVSDNLTMQVNPMINPMNNSKGVSLQFSFKKPVVRKFEVK